MSSGISLLSIPSSIHTILVSDLSISFDDSLTLDDFIALQYATTTALAIVDPVTQMLDPVKKPSVKLFAILAALAVALCFLGVSILIHNP